MCAIVDEEITDFENSTSAAHNTNYSEFLGQISDLLIRLNQFRYLFLYGTTRILNVAFAALVNFDSLS